MAKIKYFMVLDVEGMSTCKPYNVGYIIGDKHGNIVMERSFALPECIWQNLQNCFHAEEMTHKNVEEILADFGSGDKRKYDYVSNAEFKRIFEQDIKSFNIKTIWAYNVNFDKGALARLYEIIPLPDVEFADIWSAVTYSRCMTKKYVNFCIKNGFVTEKGNIKTSAEVVYAYYTKNILFEEEHTGLADCHIEYKLLLWAYATNKKLVKKHPRQIWRVMAELVQPAE